MRMIKTMTNSYAQFIIFDLLFLNNNYYYINFLKMNDDIDLNILSKYEILQRIHVGKSGIIWKAI